MTYYTPLRYPGGKRRLASFVKRLLEENGLRDVVYAEPYAGGASLALELLFEEYASSIHINDLSRPVYAFWHSVLHQTDELCRRIERTPVTMEEWYRQRAIYDVAEDAELLDLGFAAFFLNRTNRSGILSGGVIGGKGQSGQWGLDARFNRDELALRVRRVGRYRNRIRLHNQDALEFTEEVITSLPASSLTFFDPPYIAKGASLYLNSYEREDHVLIAKRVMQLEQPWIVTYDYDPAVELGLYSRCSRLSFELSYSAQERRGGREALYLSRDLRLPTAESAGIPMTPSGSRFPIYATVEVEASRRRRRRAH